MNKKIVITGSGGFVGNNIYKKLNKYYNVIGISRSDSYYTDRIIDITNEKELNYFLDQERPDIIVHCAYYPNVEGCEIDSKKAQLINLKGTSNVIDWCKKEDKNLIFLSTDYVYSLNGDKLNKETDAIGYLNTYTKHKIHNEREITEKLSNYLIIRSGFIYGYDPKGKNFLMQMLESEGKMNVPSDQIVNPTYVVFLAEIIEKAIELNLQGILNANGKESISRLDFAKQISEIINLKNMPSGIAAENVDYKAKRPLFCKVDSSLIYQKTGIMPLSNEAYLLEIKRMIDEKKHARSEIFYRRKNCRGCKKENLVRVISMGEVPIANSFLKERSDERKIPLDVYFCKDCYLFQILDVVSSESLFADYRYASSVSQKVKEHFKKLAYTIKDKFNLSKQDIILEIGSNDGVLLRELKSLGLNAIGIDPSFNITKVARKEGLFGVNAFFGEEIAREFSQKYGKAKIISASNVFAHIDDLDDIIRGVNEVMSDGGILIVEVHYIVSLIENFQFDNIYHEHVCEYSATAFNNLLNRFDLEIYDVERLPIHGGSIRFYAKKKTNSLKIKDSVREVLKYEKEGGFISSERYINFAQKIDSLKKELIDKIKNEKEKGNKIAGYGASARGTILLNICNLNDNYLEYVVDNSSEKQGRYIPGVNLKIVPASYLREKIPDKVLVLAYTYAKEIMRDENWFVKQGGEFILPNIDVFDN